MATLLATWFGCGLSPKAPGTVGSLGALATAFVLQAAFGWPSWAFAVLAAAITPAAVWSAAAMARQTGSSDPQKVVIDEVAGQWLTLAGAVDFTGKTWLLGFLLFRVFDIAKPFPLRRLERLHGGWGIVSDDLGAGIYAGSVLYAIGWVTG